MKKLFLVLVLLVLMCGGCGAEKIDTKSDCSISGKMTINQTFYDMRDFIKKPQYDGYFIDGIKKYDCVIIDESLSDYKIKYKGYTVEGIEGAYYYEGISSEWIPKSKFTKYPTYQDLLDDYIERHKEEELVTEEYEVNNAIDDFDWEEYCTSVSFKLTDKTYLTYNSKTYKLNFIEDDGQLRVKIIEEEK